MTHDMPILIAGPTASGKSDLAVSLAARVNGCIINADSRQIYDALYGLTAQPTAMEKARVPHSLYGHVAPHSAYSVGQWQVDALAAIKQAQQAGQTPIVVGGTGLYFRSLTEGLVAISDIPDALRQSLRERLRVEGSVVLHGELAAIDSVLAARLAATDGQRIVRGLEVFHATGRPLSDWHNDTPAAPLGDYRGLVLMPDRDWLYTRINARFEAMLTSGALDEVRHLLALNLSANMPIMQVVGVAVLAAHLAGDLSRAEAIAKAQQQTRHYAKRQMTWFRNQMSGWKTASEQEYANKSSDSFHLFQNIA